MRKLDSAGVLTAGAVGVLLLALSIGGSADAGDNPALQLAALALLGLALWQLPAGAWPRSVRVAVILAGVAVALPVLQLLPLPAALASGLPGRAALAAELAAVGAGPLSQVSLIPSFTERALWGLLPALALFAAGLALPAAARLRLLTAVVAFAIGSVVLGLAQIAGGPDSTLRFYQPTHQADAVGFFANRNHFAALLYVALVLGVGLLAAHWRRGQSRRYPGTLAAVVVVFCLVGLGLARSRMGLALGMLALIGAAVMLLRAAPAQGRAARRWLVVTAVIGATALVQITLYGVLARFDTDPLHDERWRFFAQTRALAADYAPLGSGFGSFVDAYESAQAPQQQRSFYVNHAHNDYLELALEGGWPAIAWMTAFAAWWLWCSVAAWRGAGTDALLARAASLALGLLMAHAVVDYALRTGAMLAVGGLLCAAMVPPLRRPDARRAHMPRVAQRRPSGLVYE